jgi:hypothetical protein
LFSFSTTCTGIRIVRAGDRLADPPGCVGGELEALAVVELLGGPHQAQRALLDQVEERQALVAIVLGDRDDQAKVGLDHLLLRVEIAALDPLGEVDLFLGGQQPNLADVLEEQLQGVGRHVRLEIERCLLAALPTLGFCRPRVGRRCLRRIDVFDELDTLTLEVAVKLLDVALVHIDLGERGGDFAVGDHALLLALLKEGLDLLQLLKLCNQHQPEMTFLPSYCFLEFYVFAAAIGSSGRLRGVSTPTADKNADPARSASPWPGIDPGSKSLKRVFEW